MSFTIATTGTGRVRITEERAEGGATTTSSVTIAPDEATAMALQLAVFARLAREEAA